MASNIDNMNSKGQALIGAIIMLGLIVLIYSPLIWYFVHMSTHYDTECLDEIGKSVCEEQGLVFSNNFFPSEKVFICKSSDRIIEAIKFEILKEDMEKCRK